MTDTTPHPLVRSLQRELASAPTVCLTRDRFGYKVNGKFYRRVTTLLGGLPKPWLGAWAANQVAEFAVTQKATWNQLADGEAIRLLKGVPWSKRDAAGDRGTAVHNTIEACVRGEPLPDCLTTEDELACAIAAETFLKARGSRILGCEITVFNDTHEYAGTLDVWEVAKDGETWITDWKTSRDVYAEYAVQQTAYQRAEFAIVQKAPDPGKKGEAWLGKQIAWKPEYAKRLGIVHVTPEAARLHPIRCSERLWTVFRAAAHVKLWQSDVDSYNRAPKEVVYDEPEITPLLQQSLGLL